MKVIEPSFEILTPISDGGIEELKLIERIGRVCYKSEEKITEDGESAKRFVKMLVSRGHEAMIEHGSISVKFICDRGVSHELVRHRIASFAQESTRYCNYSQDKFGNELTFIKPCFWPQKVEGEPNRINPLYNMWYQTMADIEDSYFYLINNGATPQEARSVLPNSLKTEITVTANYREWRNIFKFRTAMAAHPQMREIMRPLLDEFKSMIPVLFDDITYEE